MSEAALLRPCVLIVLASASRYTGRSFKLARGRRIDGVLKYQLIDAAGNTYGVPMPLDLLHGYACGLLMGARIITDEVRKIAQRKLEKPHA